MNNYLKQIWYELRHQPMVTITSVMGTAFAIFLMMAVFMTSSLDTVPRRAGNKPPPSYVRTKHTH